MTGLIDRFRRLGGRGTPACSHLDQIREVAAPREPLRGVRRDREHVGGASTVPRVRAGRLLRPLAESPRTRPLHRHGSRDHAGRPPGLHLDLVLGRRDQGLTQGRPVHRYGSRRRVRSRGRRSAGRSSTTQPATTAAASDASMTGWRSAVSAMPNPGTASRTVPTTSGPRGSQGSDRVVVVTLEDEAVGGRTAHDAMEHEVARTDVAVGDAVRDRLTDPVARCGAQDEEVAVRVRRQHGTAADDQVGRRTAQVRRAKEDGPRPDRHGDRDQPEEQPQAPHGPAVQLMTSCGASPTRAQLLGAERRRSFRVRILAVVAKHPAGVGERAGREGRDIGTDVSADDVRARQRVLTAGS